MKKTFLLLLTIVLSELLIGQTVIKGKLIDNEGKAVPFANVYIKGSYDGATSADDGSFKFSTSETGEQLLVASSVGYETLEKPLLIEGEEIVLNLEMKLTVNELDYVVITAGAFEASDEKKAVVLKPLDIVTTAGAAGDVYGALQKLPGSQLVGEKEGLFVRGGAGYETKTLIDGMIVQNPYYSPVPDVPSRGRFYPFLFKGTVFSTGGYSAQYGQALSSVLLLNTEDLAEKTATGVGLNFVGTTLSHTQRWKNSSLSIGGAYTNLDFYLNVFKQNTEWVETPKDYTGEIIYRLKPSKTGMFKFYSTYSTNDMAIQYPRLDDLSQKEKFEQENENIYLNTSYKDALGDKWTYYAAFSHSTDFDKTLIDTLRISSDEKLSQGRITFTRLLGKSNDIKFGVEAQDLYIDGLYNNYTGVIDETFGAAYAEYNWFITPKLGTRVGVRVENSELLENQNVAPRVSVAYKTSKHGQVSAAYGNFYQRPDNEYLFQMGALDYKLDFESANHYILNYQWMKQDEKTFRVELYQKDYDKLAKFEQDSSAWLQNKGFGYARGLDVFWRDQKSIKNMDYWISYSFLDTERKFKDYPIAAEPNFTSKHNLSVITKYWFTKILTNVSFTYSYASGRPYYNPNKSASEFHSDYSPDYHNLSFGLSKLTSIFGQFAVVYASIDNIFDRENVFGYRYSSDGEIKVPIRPASPRSYFLGIFISIEYD